MVTAVQTSRQGDPFPADRFVTIADVPVLVEHQTTARDGRRLRFGREELAAIARRCNQRIDSTGDYAAVTLGHTPRPGEQKGDPPLVGFAGPFRLGKVGEKYAVLADLHIYREDIERVKKYPRRSPELWLEKSYDRMVIDPIALLGAEPPRLDMGLSLLYSARRDGQVIEKYAAAHPAAASVFVPEETDSKPIRNRKEDAMALSQEDIQQLIEALDGLDWLQWIKERMATPSDADDKNGATEPTEPEPEPYQQPSDKIDPGKARQILEDGEVDGKPLTEEQRKMFAAAAAREKHQKSESEMVERYSRLQGDFERLQAELRTERNHRINAERYSRLADLRNQYAFDLEKETKRCAAERMTPEQFDDHLTVIRENYQRLPLDRGLPAAVHAPVELDREKYQRELADRALAVCERKALNGESVDYEAELQRLKNGGDNH